MNLKPPVWQSDDEATECHLCTLQFGFFRRRHHCRHCGFVVCADCSDHFTRRLPFLSDYEDHRLCGDCAKLLNKLHPTEFPLTLSPTLKLLEQEWLSIACFNNFDKRNQTKKSADNVLEKLQFGIAPELRSTVWPALTQSIELQVSNPNLYSILVQHSSEKIRLVIEADVKRIFPDDASFANTAESQKALLRLLAAHAARTAKSTAPNDDEIDDKQNSKPTTATATTLTSTTTTASSSSTSTTISATTDSKKESTNPTNNTASSPSTSSTTDTSSEVDLYDDPYIIDIRASGQLVCCVKSITVSVDGKTTGSYRQEMVYYAAVVLSVCDEEASFWLFTQMLTTYGIGDYFAATAPGLTRMLTTLEKRFQKSDPELAAHFV